MAKQISYLNGFWNGSRSARIHFWIPDPVFKAQTWLVNPTSSRRRDQVIFSRLHSRRLRGMARQAQSIDHEVKHVEKMAHDPAVVDIKGGGRHPGAGLVLANVLFYDNTQRACLALSRVVRLHNAFKLWVFELAINRSAGSMDSTKG